MTDTSLITFKAISNFTNCLCEVFGEDHRCLKLYAHLINKTTISHEKPILKHIEAFRVFCVNNRDAIESKDYTKFEMNNITYSDKVFISMNEVFKCSDRETSSIIWKHILTISALVDPAGRARQILKESSENNNGEAQEVDFLQNIIEKVEKNVDPNANPMEAITSIMQSGIFQDLVSGMGSGLQNGSLDLGKLMGTVQKMVGGLNGENGEGNDDTMNLMNTMMSNLSAGSMAPDNNGTEGMPDLSNIMAMVGPMLGALNGGMPNNSNSVSVEDNINNQLKQLKNN